MHTRIENYNGNLLEQTLVDIILRFLSFSFAKIHYIAKKGILKGAKCLQK